MYEYRVVCKIYRKGLEIPFFTASIAVLVVLVVLVVVLVIFCKILRKSPMTNC